MLTDIFKSTMSHIFNSYINQNKEKNIIIDPMTSLIKLSLLNYYPKGTKIGICNDKIYFHEPSYFQGALRYLRGDGREDLHNLYNPIKKAIEWYWNETDREINYLFNQSILGLKKLKTAYNVNSTIQYTLDYYIHSIQIKTFLYDNTNEIILTTRKSEKNKIHEYLKELWSNREIHIIIELLQEMESKQEELLKPIQESIQKITETKEHILYEFLKEHASVLV